MTDKTGAALLLCALLFSAALAGCRQQPAAAPAAENAAVTIAVSVEPDPPAVGAAALIVTLTGPQGQAVSGAQVSARGDMTHPGMAPVLAEAECDSGGHCEIPFEWTMGGDWVVEIAVTLPDGSIVQQQFAYTVGS